jgi:hypothetical protein
VRDAGRDEHEVAGGHGVDLREPLAVAHRRGALEDVDRRLVTLVHVRPRLAARRDDQQVQAQALG